MRHHAGRSTPSCAQRWGVWRTVAVPGRERPARQ